MSPRWPPFALLAALLVASCAGDRRPDAARPDAPRPDAARGDLGAPAEATTPRHLRLVAGGMPQAPGGGWKALRRRVEARLPRRADLPFEIRVQGGPRLLVRHLGSGPAEAVERQGRVGFGEVTPGVDSVFETHDEGIEQYFVLKRTGLSAEQELELPRGYRLQQAAPGLVEVRDGAGRARARVRAEAAWDCEGRPARALLSLRGQRLRYEALGVGCWPAVIDPLWTSTERMSFARSGHAAAALGDGRVLIAGGGQANQTSEVFDPQAGTFTLAGQMLHGRTSLVATALLDGRVSLSSGYRPYAGVEEKSYKTEGEIFDPFTGRFTLAGSGYASPQKAVLMRSGKVLLWGSQEPSVPDEVFDPTTLQYSPTVPRNTAWGVGDAALVDDERVVSVAIYSGVFSFSPETFGYALLGPTAYAGKLAPLPSGNLLLTVSGNDPLSLTLSPANGHESATGRSSVARSSSTLEPLADGQLLLSGGSAPLTETYDERETRFFDAPALQIARIEQFRTTPLATGKVLLTGGRSLASDALTTAELFDPSSASLVSTSVQVGGCAPGFWAWDRGVLKLGGNLSRLVEVFDADTERFRSAGLMDVIRPRPAVSGLSSGRIFMVDRDFPKAQVFLPASWHIIPLDGVVNDVSEYPSAVTLVGERVLLSGGTFGGLGGKPFVVEVGQTELQFYPAEFAQSELHLGARLPSGRALLVGGRLNEPQANQTHELHAMFFDGTLEGAGAHFFSSGAMNEGRIRHSLTLLGGSTDEEARVLVAGGGKEAFNGGRGKLACPDPYDSAYVFSVASGQFEPTGPMTIGRSAHGATLLASGEVLLAGGVGRLASSAPDRELASTEIFSPADLTFRPGPDMSEPRRNLITARLGTDGRVLIAGGCWQDNDTQLAAASVDIFDPATGQLRPPRGEPGPRLFASATRLPSGEVLVAGGEVEPGVPTPSAELHGLDPQQVTPLPDMGQARHGHTATMLSDGRVLLVGGGPGAEVFDPVARSFTPTSGAPLTQRRQHAAALLPDGRVLLVGGLTGEQSEAKVLASAEIYDPPADHFSEAAPALRARRLAGAARLLDGRVLLVGGDEGTFVDTLEVYDPRLGAFVGLGVVPSLDRGGVPGRPFAAAALATGEVLVAGPRLLALLDPATLDVEFLESASDGASGLLSLPTGDALACGPGERGGDDLSLCLRFDPSTRSLAEPLRHGLSLPGMALAPTATGDALLRGALGIPGRRRGALATVDLAPRGALRPRIDEAPARLRPGESFDVKGSRFLRWPAREAAERNWRPEIVPSVAFVPASGGPAAFGLVMQRGDTHLRVVAPRSAMHGPGWLHVVVMGVASEGRFVQLDPVEQGAACGFDGECDTGSCAEGVCCDRRCDSGCESCRARADGGLDGVCAPLAAGQPPRFGCLPESSGDVCAPTGVCDGLGACALPPTSTACSTASVPSGVCAGGRCVVAPRARCSDDVARVLQPDGSEAPCEPFACRDGACLTRCRSRLDCAPGLRCSERGACVAAQVDKGSAGCSAAPARRGPGGLWPLVALLLGPLRRQRWQRRRRGCGPARWRGDA